jgi:hypothetical protein
LFADVQRVIKQRTGEDCVLHDGWLISSRLYVVVRGDLTQSQQAVQAGHAVASWHVTIKNSPQETLVYLKVADEKELSSCLQLVKPVSLYHIPVLEFREPDMNNELTAIASGAFVARRLFKDLLLL